MAIVDSPLLSLGARKSLGKTITFMRVKGQNVARQRVIPANPRSAGQVAQRGYLASAVELFHSAGLTETDLAALNRWATASYRKMSGYNLHTSQVSKYLAAGDGEVIVTDVQAAYVDETDASCEFLFEDSDTGSVTIHWGTTRTSQPNSEACAYSAGSTWQTVMSPLVEDRLYYFYLEYQSPDENGTARTGLYEYKHEA